MYHQTSNRCLSGPLDHDLFHGRQTGHGLALDPALVLAAHDPEVAVLAPVVTPRVCQQPVVDSVVGSAPAHELNGMAPQDAAVQVLVHAGLVVGEILYKESLRSWRRLGLRSR